MTQQLISYAQNFEDVMLWRALGHVQGGRYVDIGAQSPEVDSVSRLFHERGWRGIHVEPMPDYATQLRQSRPDDLVIQAAIGATAGSLTFYEIAETGLSTSKQEIADKHAGSGFKVRETVVPAMTLDDLLSSFHGPDLHWLKIDVEGAEQDVLKGWTTSPIRPWVVVVESTLPLTKSESHGAWEPLLSAKGYRFAYFDGLNRFYVSGVHEELLAAFTCGPNVFDDFSLAPSSAFCATVNIGYHALEKLRESEQQEVEASRAETQWRIEVANAEIGRLDAEKLAQQAGFEARIESERQRSEALGALCEQHALRERELGEQIQLRDAELVKLAAQAQLEQARLSALRDAHLAQIDRFQAHVAWLDGVVESFRREKQATEVQTDEARRDAHRWWMEAEKLRRELVRMEDSHSWRITAPLRDARRLAANLVRFPVRTAKVAARPVVIWIMRRAMAVPFLRVRMLRLLDVRPALKIRFRNLALSSGLIQGRVEASSATLRRPRVNAIRHNVSQTAPSARAVKVLADLRRAIQEKHG